MSIVKVKVTKNPKTGRTRRLVSVEMPTKRVAYCTNCDDESIFVKVGERCFCGTTVVSRPVYDH